MKEQTEKNWKLILDNILTDWHSGDEKILVDRITSSEWCYFKM